MLLDSYTIKNGVAGLLDPAPAGYIKRVTASFQKIDTLLKTLQVRESPPEALIQAYLIHIADKSDSNFRKILEIKGIRSKQEQTRLLELFQIHRNSDRHAPNLQQSNPLIAQLQPPNPPGVATSSSVTQGLSLGVSTLGTSSTSPATTRFDASTLGSALISAARDGVGLGGSGAAGNASGATASESGSGTPTLASGTSPAARGDSTEGSSATGNLNENLKNIGKFFRRDLGGFGGRFGRGGDEK